MKKIYLFFTAFIMLLSLGLTGCGAQEASAEGFKFTYKTDEITSENNNKYLKLTLEVKNTLSEENTLEASKFILKKDTETISNDVIIGNNIIDAMETETFESMQALDTTISITLTETLDGTYQLYYGETQLFEINAQKMNNSSSNTDANTN